LTYNKSTIKNGIIPKQHGLIEIIYAPEITNVLKITKEAISEMVVLEKSHCEKLIEFLKTEISSSEIKLDLIKEMDTTSNRKNQLIEAKDIVFSLRETEKTSDTAMNFLQERLNLLQKEREDIELQILVFQEKFESSYTEEALQSLVETFTSEIKFQNTEEWDKDLDYFRTRFLLQREQETEDQKLKAEFLPENYVERSTAQEEKQKSQIIRLAIHKKYFEKIKSLSMQYNRLKVLSQKTQIQDIDEKSDEEIKDLIKTQESESFEIGKELYTLKREQGILTLKTYDIVQTLKSRLLNITGSLASRRFMKEALVDLKNYSQDMTLSFTEKKQIIIREVARLLRIVRKQPSENS